MTKAVNVDSGTVAIPVNSYDRFEVAGLAGVAPDSISAYVSRSRKKAASGEQLGPEDIPLPKGRIGGAAWWNKAEIDAWLPNRREAGQRGPDKAPRPPRARKPHVIEGTVVETLDGAVVIEDGDGRRHELRVPNLKSLESGT